MFDFNKILSESDNSIQIKTNTIGSKIALETIDRSSDLIHNINEDFSVLMKDLSDIRYSISKDIMRSNIVSAMYTESSDVTQPFTVDAYNYTFDRTNKYPTFNPLIEILEETYTDIIEKDRREIYRGDANRRESLYKILKESAIQLIKLSRNATSAVNGGAKSINEDNFIYKTYSSYRGGKETLPYKITVTPHMIQNISEFAETMTEGIELYDKAFNRTTRLVNKLIESVQDIAPDYVTILKESVVDYINCANIAYAIKADAVAEYISTFFNESGYSRETNTELSFSQLESRNISHDFYDGIFNESEDFDEDDYNILKSMDEVAYIPMLEDMKGAYINYLGTKMSETLIGIHEADEGGFFLVRWWNKLVDWVKGIFEKEAEQKTGANSKMAANINWIEQNYNNIIKICKELDANVLMTIFGYNDGDKKPLEKFKSINENIDKIEEYITNIKDENTKKQEVQKFSESIGGKYDDNGNVIFDKCKLKEESVMCSDNTTIAEALNNLRGGINEINEMYRNSIKVIESREKSLNKDRELEYNKLVDETINYFYTDFISQIKTEYDKVITAKEAYDTNSNKYKAGRDSYEHTDIGTVDPKRKADTTKALSTLKSNNNTSRDNYNSAVSEYISKINESLTSLNKNGDLNRAGLRILFNNFKKLGNIFKYEKDENGKVPEKVVKIDDSNFNDNAGVKEGGIPKPKHTDENEKDPANGVKIDGSNFNGDAGVKGGEITEPKPGQESLFDKIDNSLITLLEDIKENESSGAQLKQNQNWDNVINGMKQELTNEFKRQNVFNSMQCKVDATREIMQNAHKAASVYVDDMDNYTAMQTNEFKKLVEYYNNKIAQQGQDKLKQMQQDANDAAKSTANIQQNSDNT